MPSESFAAESDNPATRPRIAAAPVTWNNNDLENWRPRIPFPEILDRITEAGYRATEYDASFGPDPETVRTEASRRSLEFCGSYQWLDLSTPGDVIAEHPSLEATLALLSDIDCRHLVIADSLRPHRVAIAGAVPRDGSASLDADGFARIASNASRVADLASHYGIRVHYHNHVGTYVETPEEVEGLLASLDTDKVDLCFDTGHFAFGGGDARAFVERHAGVIGYVHLKDVDAAVMKEAHRYHWSFLDALRHYVFADIGTGVAQVGAILGILAGQPAPPWIVIEQDTCAEDSTQTAARNLRSVRTMLANLPRDTRDERM